MKVTLRKHWLTLGVRTSAHLVLNWLSPVKFMIKYLLIFLAEKPSQETLMNLYRDLVSKINVKLLG